MKKSIFLLLLFCSAFMACKREYDDSKFGPETIIVAENFTVTGFTINPSSTINLASQDAYFNCTMSQRAEFKIVIYGLTSGASKTIRGVGESIGMANSLWNGDSDNLIIFRTGEDCSVELSFHGATKKYYDTLTVTLENNYPNTTLINTIEGITFDKNGPNTGSYGNYFDGSDFTVANIKSDNSLFTFQGSQSLSFEGIDANKSYYIGGMYFYPSTSTYVFNGYSPDSLYFNTYVYSYGDKSSNLTFTFSEDDNGDNIIDATNDDVWSKQITVDGAKGWSLVSIRFKDFTDGNTTAGNGTFNLNKIKGFNINFNAINPGSYAHTNLDYLIVSYGRPFEP